MSSNPQTPPLKRELNVERIVGQPRPSASKLRVLRRITLILFGLILSIFGRASVAVAADPSILRLQYIFLGSEQPASQSLNAIFKEQVDSALTGTANSFRDPNTYRIDVLAEISADRSTVSFLDFRYVDLGLALSVTNQFDLGFSGTVPYTARLDQFRYELAPVTVSLAIDGTFNTGFVPSMTTLAGSSTMFGTALPFSLSGATTTRIQGQFLPMADPSQTKLQLTITARSPEGIVRTETFNGHTLQLVATADANSPSFNAHAPVPEPNVALLFIGAGVAVSYRRRRICRRSA